MINQELATILWDALSTAEAYGRREIANVCKRLVYPCSVQKNPVDMGTCTKVLRRKAQAYCSVDENLSKYYYYLWDNSFGGVWDLTDDDRKIFFKITEED